MRITVTGSRYGMHGRQSAELIELFASHPLTEFHYGDCVGTDEEAMWLWVQIGSGVGHSHPATMNSYWDAKWRARTAERFPELGIIEHEAKHPLKRNWDMVDSSDEVWAFPDSPFEEGGTWATIHYAQSKGVPVLIFLP